MSAAEELRSALCGHPTLRPTKAQLDALESLDEVARAARELLTHVPLPLEPTSEDIRRIVGLDVALSRAGA